MKLIYSAGMTANLFNPPAPAAGGKKFRRFRWKIIWLLFFIRFFYLIIYFIIFLV